MKYSLNYNQNTEYAECISKANEWNIVYNSKDTTLLEFLNLHKDKRINIYFKEKVEQKFLEDLCDKYNNIYLKLNYQEYKDFFLDEQNKPKIRFFFDIEINDIDILNGVLKLGVTDVYLVENLCFELKELSTIIHSYNTSIRVYPNVAQSKWYNTPALKKFFIRPEDIDFYEDYIDTIELYNVDKQIDIYYNIYAIKKKWFGKLNEIIIDFNSEIDNKYIIPRFAEMRIKCNKKCFKGGRCRRCDIIEQLSDSLEAGEIVVKIDNK